MRTLFTLLLSGVFVTATAQVRKVLFERFTGAWCGNCPEGVLKEDSLEAALGASIITVSHHTNDAVEIPEADSLRDYLGVSGVPRAMVDRNLYAGETSIALRIEKWAAVTGARAAAPAILSIGIDSAAYNAATGIYTAIIRAQFSSAPAAGVPLRLHVGLLEDSVEATGVIAQTNYSAGIQGGASPLTAWWHNGVLREAVSGLVGWADLFSTTPVAGVPYSRTVSFAIPAGWNPAHMRVLAFVAYDASGAAGTKEVVNAEVVRLSSFANSALGMEENHTAAVLRHIYPNPAVAGSSVAVEYFLPSAGRVSLQVLNAAGRPIATPVQQSAEAAGAHTVYWHVPSGLPAGLYFIRLQTGGNSAVQRFLVR